jgi:hypothetical protein
MLNNGSGCLSDQAKIALLQELIKDAKTQIRNGFILGLAGLILASLGFLSYAESLAGFNLGWLALGMAGAAMVIAAFYLMIHADIQQDRWKRELGNATLATDTSSTAKSPEPEASESDEYFDENYEKWKKPFEEDKERTP